MAKLKRLFNYEENEFVPGMTYVVARCSFETYTFETSFTLQEVASLSMWT